MHTEVLNLLCVGRLSMLMLPLFGFSGLRRYLSRKLTAELVPLLLARQPQYRNRITSLASRSQFGGVMEVLQYYMSITRTFIRIYVIQKTAFPCCVQPNYRNLYVACTLKLTCNQRRRIATPQQGLDLQRQAFRWVSAPSNRSWQPTI